MLPCADMNIYSYMLPLVAISFYVMCFVSCLFTNFKCPCEAKLMFKYVIYCDTMFPPKWVTRVRVSGKKNSRGKVVHIDLPQSWYWLEPCHQVCFQCFLLLSSIKQIGYSLPTLCRKVTKSRLPWMQLSSW